MTIHCRVRKSAPKSRPIEGSAMLTTVASSIAIPEPEIVASSTHRPAGVPILAPAEGALVTIAVVPSPS
ncbi:MAG: hypothetical protein WCE71_09480 [Pseudonocardiaceae bacterium]